MIRPARWTWILLVGLAFCLVDLSTAQAQEDGEEEEGVSSMPQEVKKTRPRPLDVVQSRFFYKKDRLEIFPHMYSGVLSNQFANRFLVLSGVSVAYHMREGFFLEGVAQFFPYYPFYDDLKSLSRLLAQQVKKDSYLPDVPKEHFYLGAAIGVSPIYGKINLVSTYVQNFDISFIGGVGLLSVDKFGYRVTGYDDLGRAELSDRECNTEYRGDRNGDGVYDLKDCKYYYITPSIGLTTRFFLTRWLTLRADARGHGYLEDVYDYQNPTKNDSGEIIGYPTRKAFQSSFILSAGLSGFLPFQQQR